MFVGLRVEYSGYGSVGTVVLCDHCLPRFRLSASHQRTQLTTVTNSMYPPGATPCGEREKSYIKQHIHVATRWPAYVQRKYMPMIHAHCRVDVSREDAQNPPKGGKGLSALLFSFWSNPFVTQ